LRKVASTYHVYENWNPLAGWLALVISVTFPRVRHKRFVQQNENSFGMSTMQNG
jgi:hypothetical protein